MAAGCYHADLPKATRSSTHEDWLAGRIQVVVATVAFGSRSLVPASVSSPTRIWPVSGMGIDKPDVRWVAHACIAKSIENYYQVVSSPCHYAMPCELGGWQESGRAGRDGAEAWCVLYFRLADLFRLSTMVVTEKTGLAKLYPMAAYALGTACRRTLLAGHFEEPWESDWCQVHRHIGLAECLVSLSLGFSACATTAQRVTRWRRRM